MTKNGARKSSIYAVSRALAMWFEYKTILEDEISYFVKNSKYVFGKAVVLLNEAIDLNNKAKNIKWLKERDKNQL